MDDDTADKSTLTPPNPRPTATDPRLNRLPKPSPSTSQINQTSTTPKPGPPPNPSLSVQKNAPTASPSSDTQGSNGVHSAKSTQDAPPGDLGQIIPQLTRLMDSRAALVWKEHEKAVLEKEDALLRRNLARAKALPVAFPSLVDSLQSMRDKPPTELQKLDSELSKQQAMCSDMAKELRAMLVARSPSEKEKAVELEAKITEDLKAELKEELKAELKEELWGDLREQFRAEIKGMQSASIPQDAIPPEYKEKLSQLENSVVFVSTSNRNLGAQISRVEKWKKEVEEGRIRLRLQSEAPAESNSEANPELEKLAERLPALDTRLSKVEQHHETAQNVQKSQITALEAQLHQIQENAATSSAKIATLENQPRASSTEDLVASETLLQKAEHIHRALLDQVNNLLLQVPELRGASEGIREQRDAIQTLSTRMDGCQKVQETMTVALRSLEHRYVNITSENLVKSMVHAMQEMYPGMQKQIDQLNSLQAQFNSNRDQLTKEIDSLKSSKDNDEKASITVALQEFKQISEQSTQLQETQKSQAGDIVRHLKEVKELRNQLEGHSLALAELGEKHADDFSDLSEEMKALAPKFGEYDSRLESQAKQCKDSQESFQRLRTQLETIQEFSSEDNIKRICEDAQREKLQVITGQMEEFNSQAVSLLKRIEDIQTKGFGSSDLSQESLQTLTRGLLSAAAGSNGTSTTPQNTNSWREVPTAPRADSNPASTWNAPQAPAGPRRMPNPVSTAPSPGTVGGPFKIKGAASQHESERGRAGSTSQSTPQNDSSHEVSMSSRVTANPLSPTMTTLRTQNSTPGQDLPTASGAPGLGPPSNPHVQAHAGKKRMRQPTISEDESRDDESGNSISSNMVKPSPAASSASDLPLRRSKKAKKKKKQSQLK